MTTRYKIEASDCTDTYLVLDLVENHINSNL